MYQDVSNFVPIIELIIKSHAQVFGSILYALDINITFHKVVLRQVIQENLRIAIFLIKTVSPKRVVTEALLIQNY